jgi:dihydrodipicolinate synthase/N-acetylneuraminate lyase
MGSGLKIIKESDFKIANFLSCGKTRGVQKLGGVFNVLSTPIDGADEIDLTVFEKEIEWLLKCGMNGAVLAMVSEVLRFSAAERRDQWKAAVKFLNGRAPLVVSVGAESSAIAIKLAKDAESDGASALMATPPSAFAATADEVKNYYVKIIEAVAIPVIVQDASNYLGKPIELSTYVELIDTYGNERVQFKPEAKPVKERLEELNKISGNRAKVFEGQGGIDLLDTHPLGVVGTMPGSEVPWALVALWKALNEQNLSLAQSIHTPLAKLISFQTTLDAYVSIEKYLLVKQGVLTNMNQRGPVGYKLTSEVEREIDKAYEDLAAVVKPVSI